MSRLHEENFFEPLPEFTYPDKQKDYIIGEYTQELEYNLQYAQDVLPAYERRHQR